MKGVSGRAIAVGVGSHAGKVGKGERNPDVPHVEPDGAVKTAQS
jgi:hypothetical protein